MTPDTAIEDVLAGRSFKQVDPNGGDDAAEKLAPEVGDQFIGTLTEIFEFDSKYKKDTKVKGYKLTALNGDPKVLIQKGNLAWQMSPVKPGQLVKIERLPDETLDNEMVSSSWVVSVAE